MARESEVPVAIGPNTKFSHLSVRVFTSRDRLNHKPWIVHSPHFVGFYQFGHGSMFNGWVY